MTTESIENIKESNILIKESLKKIKASSYKDQFYGKESEFTAKGLVAGIDAISKDISALTKAYSKFLKRSSSQEREKIADLMNVLDHALQTEDLNQASESIDQLKPIIRNIDIRHSNERLEAFDEQIDYLQRSKSNLDELIKDVIEKNEKFTVLNQNMAQVKEELETKVHEYENSIDELNLVLSKSNAIFEKISQTSESSLTVFDEIEEYHSNANSQTQIIDNFVKKIAQRETQIEDQEEKTRNYISNLDKYTNERANILEEAKGLIDTAKTALEFKTAEGLSAAFAAKLDEAKKDKTTIAWALAALIFIFLAVGLGAWSLNIHASDDTISLLLGRLSLVPVLLLGAVFSASQYVKNKNIIEDYAYKSVLAKSLVGFSEQLSDATSKGEIHSHFVKSLLAQIHNDPLHKNRFKVQKQMDMDSVLSGFTKILDKKLNLNDINTKGKSSLTED